MQVALLNLNDLSGNWEQVGTYSDNCSQYTSNLAQLNDLSGNWEQVGTDSNNCSHYTSNLAQLIKWELGTSGNR